MEKYFDRQNNSFVVRSAEMADFERIKEICEDRFGLGYIEKAEFSRWVLDKDFCKVAEYDGIIAGLVYLMPEDATVLERFLKLEEGYVEKVSGGKKVIHSRCAVLDKGFEGRGLMPIMHKIIFDNIEEQGFGAIFAPAWTYDGFTPMAKLLDKFNFEYIGIKENIWYDIDNYSCIICGGRCKCHAAVYQKILK